MTQKKNRIQSVWREMKPSWTSNQEASIHSVVHFEFECLYIQTSSQTDVQRFLFKSQLLRFVRVQEITS